MQIACDLTCGGCVHLCKMACCYDVVVLGAGIQGSSTAYYLTQKAGLKKVLLLEQVRGA